MRVGRGVLTHRGTRADEFEADLLFDGRLVIEAKVLERMFAPDHYTQVLCYQKFWSVPVGLLLDFGKESLIFKRIVYDDRRPTLPPVGVLLQDAPSFVTDRAVLSRLCQSRIRICSTHGLGYRDTTYRGLLHAELTAEKITHRVNPAVRVRSAGKAYGLSELKCIEVAGGCAVMVLALHERIRAADRAIVQTYLKLLDLPWGLIVNFGKQELEHQYVIRPHS